MNSLTATGRLTANCEIEYSKTTGKPRLHFSLAVMDGIKRGDGSNISTLFLDCYCFGKDNILQYLVRGKAITIQGRLTCYEYTDKNGQKQKKIQVIVNDIEFMPSQANENEATIAPNPQNDKTIPPRQNTPQNRTISQIPATAGTYTKDGFSPAGQEITGPDSFDDSQDIPF